MLKNRNGEPFTREQYDYFKKLLAENFKDEEKVDAIGFKPEDIDSVINFLFLFHIAPEFKENFIGQSFEKAQHKIYSERKKDKEHEGKSQIEKIIISTTKKRYKKVALGQMDKKLYTSDRILAYIHYQMNQRNKTEPNRKYLVNFINKYTAKVKLAMTNIRVKAHQFKNTNAARVFIDKHSKGFYHNKINHVNLFKFLSVTGRLGSNKEDLEWLSELVDVILQTPTKKKLSKDEYDLETAANLKRTD